MPVRFLQTRQENRGSTSSPAEGRERSKTWMAGPSPAKGFKWGFRRATNTSGRAAPVFGELLELCGFNVGDGPEGHAVLRPVHDVVALALGALRRCLAAGGPDKQIDDVLVALIDQG